MKQVINNESQFVVELLTMLRRERFSPVAWARFLKRSWAMSWQTARAHPTLVRSWARITTLVSVLALAILMICFMLEGPGSTLRLLPGFLFCVAWQQGDLFWHLGLNRHAKTGALLPAVGLATTCTWLRALAASFLLGRLLAGIGTPGWLALSVFLAGVATDIIDGPIARHTDTQSKLGQIGDGETDFCLYLAISIILIQNGALPVWLGLLMLLRFCVPLLAALASYFLFAHPLRFGSTVWGKCAGLAQCLYFLVLLAPLQFAFIVQPVQFPLLLVTLFLLIAAPVAQARAL